MQFIQGQQRNQTYFSTLEDQVAADNPVRLIDAFIDNRNHFPEYDFSNENHPTSKVINNWLISSRDFEKGNFNNPNIDVVFNLDPDIDLQLNYTAIKLKPAALINAWHESFQITKGLRLNNLTKMNLKINGRTIKFKIIPLTFNNKDIESVFFEKNNKTLKQTFDHHKYSRLKLLLAQKYKAHLAKKLGDFLKILKKGKDSNYLCFLNKYGDNKYCKFKIDTHLEDKGIYCYIKDDKIKYIGRCTDNFKKRINQGYGKIHPKNCFIDGQATNCHLNSIINSADNVKFGIYIMTDKSTDEIKELEKQILTCNRFEWNIQTS